MRAKSETRGALYSAQGIDACGIVLTPLSAAEFSERISAMRERRLLRPPAGGRANELTRAIPASAAIPREERERLAVEARETTTPAATNARPRTVALSYASELGDRCRDAAGMLEAIAADVAHGTLSAEAARSRTEGVVSALVRSLQCSEGGVS
jgi:hypothetical protein